MSSSNDIIARIRDNFLEAVEQDSEQGHLAAGLRETLSDCKTPKVAELTEIYQEAASSHQKEVASNGDLCK